MTRDQAPQNAHIPLAAFEQLADLCGALWKGASVAAQVLVAFAVLADGSWWPAVCAAIAAAAAKWLEHEFRASGRRTRTSACDSAWIDFRSVSPMSIDRPTAVAPLVKPLQS